MRTIVVVGVGALGSHLIQFIRNLEADIKGIDFDRIEQKNVLSQFHGKPHVSRGKTASIVQTMNFLFGRKVEGIPHKLVADNVKQLLGGADLVIDCLDNKPSRELVQGYVREHGIPCLHGAVDAAGTYGQVCWDESFKIDEGAAGAATCEDGAHLPFLAVVSSYLARATQQYWVGGKKYGYEINPADVFRY